MAGLSRRPPAVLPLSRAVGLMPWVIAIMIFLCALALAGGLSIAAATRSLSGELDRSLTVQVIEPNPDRRAEAAGRVVKALTGQPGVAAVRLVPEAELSALLEPWLGSGLADSDLPVPALIDVELQPGAPPPVDRLAALARSVAPGARIDDHKEAVGPVSNLLAVLQAVAMAVALLVALATMATVALATRASLNTHMATIEVMHLIGAKDEQIAALFRRRAGLDGLLGGIAGLVAAVLVVLLLGDRVAALGSDMLASATLGPGAWAALVLLPVAAAVLAMATAHVTVLRSLASYA